MDGKLTVTIPGVLASGLVQAQLDSWTETIGSSTCPASVGLSTIGPVSPPAGTAYFEGPAGSLVFGRVDRGPDAKGMGTITRAETFVGAVSGNTVAMKVSRSYQFANTYPNSTGILFNHVDGYPTVSVLATLTKQ